jgi:Tol biopolymer transport system component
MRMWRTFALYAGALVMAALCAGAARGGASVMSTLSKIGGPPVGQSRMAISVVGSILLINADGSDRQRLPYLPSGTGPQFEPAWSPDGKQIAFNTAPWRRADIYVMNSDGSGVRLLTHDGDEPRWSPDGKTIAFNHYLCARCKETTWTVNADGSDPHRLAPLGVDPAWSPDGETVAVVENPFTQGSRIWLVNVALGTQRAIAPASLQAFSLAWSPDGKTVALAGLRIWLFSVSHGTLRGITPATLGPTSLSWSPDGKELVFDRAYARGLWVINADGSGLRRLTRPPGGMDDTGPIWSSDGTWIGFVRGGVCQAGSRQTPTIYVVHPDGSGLHQVIQNRGCHDDFAWQPVT